MPIRASKGAWRFVALIMVVLGLGAAGCGSSHSVTSTEAESTGAPTSTAASAPSASNGPMLGTIQVRSPAFVASGVLPQRYTCRGAGIAPPLAWTGVPSGTRELVVFMIDISSKTQGTIAGGLAGIGPSVGSIAAGKIPSHAIVGRNGSGRIQWRGPCAQGQHDNLDFVIYAVRHRQHLRRGWSTRAVQRQLSQHALAAGAIGVSLK